MDYIHFNFYSENLIFKTEIDITLTEGFPQLKLKFELDLMNADDVSIYYMVLLTIIFKGLLLIYFYFYNYKF